MTSALYAQYGCGQTAPPGWRNFDASPTVLFERIPVLGRLYTKNESRFPENVEYGDIVRGLPLPENSCAAIYCSHVLEHLALGDFRSALRNTKQSLRSAGTFRLVVPDLEYYVARYSDNHSTEAAHAFLRDTCLGQETRARGMKGLLSVWLGNSRHLWMWDYKAIEVELRNAGFTAIRRAEFGDATDPKFREVESKDRWEFCLGVECRKAD